MFSANNFYQWSYLQYLKDKNFSMITYHPYGTRGYKNLQNWVSGSNKVQLDFNELISDSCVLMNDQEPVVLDSVYKWKQEHNNKNWSMGTINDLYYRAEHKDFWQSEEDQAKWAEEQDKLTTPIEHLKSITDEKTFTKLMFPGIFKPIIVHSELNSPEVRELESEFVPVYVFWHGLVSRDWYRHWKYNKQCRPNPERAQSEKRFLLYARAWTGSRKYRLRFIEQVIDNNLNDSFKHNFFELDDGEYYQEHTDCVITDYFPPQQQVSTDYQHTDRVRHIEEIVRKDNKDKVVIDGNSSAYIHEDDYNSTAIQVVAETLFETEKIHLTEKTFQPIVAGQPFLTLSAPGTLKLLKYYGFHTFDHVWDESYDQVVDPEERMKLVINEITKLNEMDQEQFQEVYNQCLEVCEHNRKHFFSDAFEQQMLTEYDHNMRTAFNKQREYSEQDPGGSRFWIADELCFNCYNTDFFYQQDAGYLKYMLERTRERYPEQYESILNQYWWARKIVESK